MTVLVAETTGGLRDSEKFTRIKFSRKLHGQAAELKSRGGKFQHGQAAELTRKCGKCDKNLSKKNINEKLSAKKHQI